jgi:rhodanese-related sulfurtransferase
MSYTDGIVHTGMTRTAALLAAASLAALSSGCGSRQEPKEISVDRLQDLLKSDSPPKVYDANGASTRREYGVIPGAVLLESSRSYPLDLLPADKASELVFYCASTWCGAGEAAARRAMEAGYGAVSVLPDGIKGWVAAGLPVGRAP